MAMRESKDLNKMELHDLFADLKAYEFEINSRNEDEPSTSVSTKVLVNAEESHAATTMKSAKQISNDAMSLFIKKFGKFMNKTHSNSNSNNNNYKSDSKDNLKCFNFDKLGHLKEDYRKPKMDDKKSHDKKNKKDLKALLAEDKKRKWADSDSDDNSSNESEDECIKCFMDNNDEVNQDSCLEESV
ncbi:putative uncharacterized protein DDB_G0271526 [Impatiens glandulifera]|uniref:putative uncharacterized protein DDB_G0271526 n=1 Tax=Impatiens glandulifera TaxID=253017 RepID=UPI001FB0F47D|nr:putative uncharacterized protein DDB_G0271526 [Impatiens glandulifera]